MRSRSRASLPQVAVAACLAAATLGAGWASAFPSGPMASSTERTTVPRLGNHALAGQRLVTGFPGPNPPKPLRKAIRRGEVAGVVIFAANAHTAAGAHAIAKRLAKIPQPKGLRQPLLLMTDQEGGLVKRIAGPPATSAEGMGARGAGYARSQGRKTGKLLGSAGVNVDLAPVLDVGRPGGAIASEHRSFGHSRKAVSKRANAFATGLRRGGTLPTAKHFPGLGAAKVNTDSAAQTIRLSKGRLRHTDEYPYSRYRKKRGLVMLSLAIYPALDKGTPAALSRTIATRELRGHVKFKGVSVSDSLGAAAAQAEGSTPEVARKAARAGTDLLLYTDLGQALDANRALAKALRHKGLRRGPFRKSVARVLKLRRQL